MEGIPKVAIGIIIYILNARTQPWVGRIDQIIKQTKLLRVYFNNHYGGKAVVNAMQFKEMNGSSLSTDERMVLERAQTYMI
jgi:uncharacterized protein YecE (DUF72 family)